MIHKPVLTKEVLEYLDPKPGENFIDGTVGQAGHTLLILEKTAPQGKVLGIDADAGQIINARGTTEKYGGRMLLVNDSYINIKEIVKENNFGPVDGILLDLGWSSWQLENSAKGFSFQKDEPLDMRYGAGKLTAAIILNTYTEAQIREILEEYGEEKFAKQIAAQIIKQRRVREIKRIFDLNNIIEEAVPAKFQHGKIHYATRTFQALRIAVNDELGGLRTVLPDAVDLLSVGGRLAVISFHSLEDRIVKDFFRDYGYKNIIKIITKKPVVAGEEEIIINPRSRSAKLRVIIKQL